jgi:type I restriction enzyme R subunit
VVFDAGRKKLPRPHQYFALKEAQKFIQQKEGGIIWHTQGSGKSILMIILAKWILENVTNSRVVILTDRTELDKQIADTFEGIGEKDIARTRSGNELMSFLTQPKPRLIASLIHKFGNKGEADYKTFIEEIKSNPIQIQGNVFVFVDECHRSQGGKLNETMKAVLQNAIFIGFTGTPLLQKDKQTTMDIFGRYIHTYKFNEAVTDGVVKDLVYEGRDIEQKLSSQDKVDAWFEAKTKGLNDFQKSELKKRWGTMQNVLSSRSRMDKIVADILFDFSVKPRLASEKGNAILVASSIYEACKYYELFLNTPFKNKCAIITSYNCSPNR